MTAIVSIEIVCDACGRKLPTARTKVAGARGDADRAGWRVAETGDGYRSQAGRSTPVSPAAVQRAEARRVWRATLHRIESERRTR